MPLADFFRQLANDEFEKQAKGNRKLAAALLGIGRTTLYNKIRLYGIKYKE